MPQEWSSVAGRIIGSVSSFNHLGMICINVYSCWLFTVTQPLHLPSAAKWTGVYHGTGWKRM